MSFRAELKIEDRMYRVLECSHTLSRDTDQRGRPSSRTYFGKIDIEIESTDDIFFWSKIALGYSEAMAGSIVFKRRDEEVTMKELFFENAYVIHHTEHYTSEGSSPMNIHFTLSAGTLIMESNAGETAEIHNDWVTAGHD